MQSYIYSKRWRRHRKWLRPYNPYINQKPTMRWCIGMTVYYHEISDIQQLNMYLKRGRTAICHISWGHGVANLKIRPMPDTDTVYHVAAIQRRGRVGGVANALEIGCNESRFIWTIHVMLPVYDGSIAARAVYMALAKGDLNTECVCKMYSPCIKHSRL